VFFQIYRDEILGLHIRVIKRYGAAQNESRLIDWDLSEYLADLRQPLTPQNRYGPKNVRVGFKSHLGALRSTVFPTILRSRGITNKEIGFALLDETIDLYLPDWWNL
jgi:hypothetical protein